MEDTSDVNAGDAAKPEPGASAPEGAQAQPQGDGDPGTPAVVDEVAAPPVVAEVPLGSLRGPAGYTGP
jgi:hypothetical protein